MHSFRYSLIPFSPLPGANLQLQASVWREPGLLQLEFILSGDLRQVELAPCSRMPRRADGLWKSTCFECFIRLAGLPGYSEVNLAPNGNWNYYGFSGYRQSMHEVGLAGDISMSRQQQDDRLRLAAQVPLIEGGYRSRPLELALSAVLADCTGGLSYWAVHHPGDRPDFHHPDSFVITLEEMGDSFSSIG